MNLHQLVGSVLMLGFRGDSLDDPETREDISQLKTIHCGGVILFDHDIKANGPRNIQSPKQLAKLIQGLRNELGSDLIIGIDQEGGQVSRLNEHNEFRPTLSAKAFSELVEIDQNQYAQQQAEQLSAIGIDLNFAPCVDLAVDPDSPIIAAKDRAFGDTIEQVFNCAHKVIDAHHQAGIACCIKHFPGHGSSMIDSHKGVCDITLTHTPQELEIFARLIDRYQNKIAVMSGHLIDSKIDPQHPASMSKAHTTNSLRNALGFDGVVVTDSMDMRAIRDHFGEGQAGVDAIDAGADLILDGFNAPGFRELGGARRVAKAIRECISIERLVESRDRLDRFFSR